MTEGTPHRPLFLNQAMALVFLLLLGVLASPVESAVRVTTDGSSSRPHCSWSHWCDWDTEAKERCAKKVCQASGYSDGDFVMEHNDMCTTSVSDQWQSYYLTDQYIYFWGKAKKEAKISADCHNNEVTTTTVPTTITLTSTSTQTSTSTTKTTTVTSTTRTSTSTSTTTTTQTSTSTTKTSTTTSTTISTSTTSLTQTSTTVTATSTTLTATATTTTITVTSTTLTSTSTSATTTTTETSTTSITTTTTTTTIGVPTTTTLRTDGGFTFLDPTTTTLPVPTTTTAAPLFQFVDMTTTTQTTTSTTKTKTSSTSTVTSTTSSTKTKTSSTATTTTSTSSTITSTTSTTKTTTVTTVTSTTTETVTMTHTSTTLTATETSTTITRSTTSTRTTQTSTSTGTSTTITSTSTRTGTTITTTSTSTTTLAQFCAKVPEVENAGDLSSCAGLATGSTCEVECNEGYEMSSGSLKCESGSWVSSGECLAVGTETTSVSAVQMFLRLISLLFSHTAAVTGSNIESGVTSNYFGKTWAMGNYGIIRRAVARSLGRKSSLCKVGVRSRRSGRRLEDSNSTDDDDDTDFEIEVTVMVDSKEADSELANNMLGQLLDGTSSSDNSTEGGNFLTALTNQLVEEDVEAPEGLSDVESSSSGPVAVIQEYYTEYSSWTTSDWGSCNALCSEGVRNRTVSCEDGLDTLCDASEKPSETMVCEDYTQCEFQVTCPLGEDSMDCTMQAGAFGVALVLGTGLVCGAAIRCLRQRQLKRRLTVEEHEGIVKGAYVVQSKGVSSLESAFCVYRPQPESMEPRKSGGSDCNFTGSELEEGKAKAKDGKTHVVWEVEKRRLQEWFAEQGTDFQMTKTGSSGVGMPRLASASRSSNTMTKTGSARSSGMGRSLSAAMGMSRSAGASLGRDVCGVISARTGSSSWEDEVTEDLAMEASVSLLGKDGLRSKAVGPTQRTEPVSTKHFVEQGAKVEYFSRNLGKWVPAIAHLTEQISGTRYDVVLTCGGQQRLKVDLDCIRKPLMPGEPVEVNTASDGWQPAVILGGNCTVGFSLQLKGESDDLAPALENIAGHLLRRRFTEGEVVWAFCNNEWVRGQVVEFEAEDMAFGAEACVLTGDEETDFQDFISPRQRPRFDCSDISPIEIATASAFTIRCASVRLSRPPQAMAPQVSGTEFEIVPTYMLRSFVRSTMA